MNTQQITDGIAENITENLLWCLVGGMIIVGIVMVTRSMCKCEDKG